MEYLSQGLRAESTVGVSGPEIQNLLFCFAVFYILAFRLSDDREHETMSHID